MSPRHRLVAAGVAMGCAGALGFAARLEPAARGHGTHESIGLPPCPWPSLFGLPCPTCGMTTAFAHAADGNVPAAFHAQPFGFMLALGIATAFWGCLHAAATGSRAMAVFGGMLRPRVLWPVAGLGVAAWVYKALTWSGA